MRHGSPLAAALLAVLALLLGACDSGTPQGTPATQSSATANPAGATPTPFAEGLPTRAATPPEDRTVAARALITQLDEGEFSEVEASFDGTMRDALPAAKLEELWGQLKAQFGELQTQGETNQTRDGEYDVVTVTCSFEKGDLDARVVFDGEGRVAGLFFGPPASSITPYPTYAAPSYVDRGAFREREVTVGSGEWVLTGTLSLPMGAGPFPGLVLVHGSGSHDRDETIGPNKPFGDLAWGLASRGIAVLRYDKRAFTHGVKMSLQADTVTVKEEVVDDARAAVRVLQGVKEVDPNKVYVLGHSLGAYLAPMIAEETSGVAGLVLLAGNTRPIEDLVVEQYTYLASVDGSVSADEQKLIDDVKRQAAAAKDPSLSPETPSESLPLGLPARYWHGSLASLCWFCRASVITR
jgi:uncharacterized protein